MYQVCTVRKSIVFVSTEQERAVANTKVTGRALVVDPGSIIPVGDANTKEFHFVNTGQGIRACSAETVLSKEVKYRRRAYADYCPYVPLNTRDFPCAPPALSPHLSF